MKDKIKILFVPFLLCIVGMTALYTFLNWALFIELELISLRKAVTNFGIPFALTGLIVLIYLRPKLKALNLEVKRGNWTDFYTFFAWILLTIPMIISQEYMDQASGKLTHLSSIREINRKEHTKYYTLKNFYVYKNSIGSHSSFDVSGKNSEHFNMHIYVTVPIFESEYDAIIFEEEHDSLNKYPVAAWLGIEYKEQISNRLEADVKEEKYKAFADESQHEFDTINLSKFVYLEKAGNSDEKEGFIQAIKNNPRFIPTENILIPQSEPFEARTGSKLKWLLITTFFGSLVWLIMIMIPGIDEHHVTRIKAGKPDKESQEEFKETIDFLIPKEDRFVTMILIYLNIAVYLVMVVAGLGFIAFNADDLIRWGGNFGPLTQNGEWWRLVTCTFLHGGLMHLLANMYGLLFSGLFVEPLLGRWKFLTVYIMTGISASCVSLWWHDATVSVGASGAIMGVYGILIALLLTKTFKPEFSKAFLLNTLFYVGITLVMGLAGGIDNAGHIGGLISGLVIGLFVSLGLKKSMLIEKDKAD